MSGRSLFCLDSENLFQSYAVLGASFNEKSIRLEIAAKRTVAFKRQMLINNIMILLISYIFVVIVDRLLITL